MASRLQEPDETTFDADIDRALTAAYEDGADALVPLRDLCKHLGEESAMQMVDDTLYGLVSDDDLAVEDAVRADLAVQSCATALSAAQEIVRVLLAREAKGQRDFDRRCDAVIAYQAARAGIDAQVTA